jgi:5-methylcytosine-specific restriction endonuclease McrA
VKNEQRRADPEHARALAKAWRDANRDQARATATAYYQRTKDDEDMKRRRYEAQRRWRQRHPEATRAKSLKDAKRRYIGRDVLGTVYAEEVLAYDVCAYCGSRAGTRDHIVPLIHGGGNDPGNLTAACTACNCAKRHRSLLGFLLYRHDSTTPEIFVRERSGLPSEVPSRHDDLLGLVGSAGRVDLAA